MDRLQKECGVKHAAASGPDLHACGFYSRAICAATIRAAATCPEGDQHSVPNA